MPTKQNWAGEQQEYYPSGSSKGGEYAANSGQGGAKFDGKVEQDFNDPKKAQHNLVKEQDFEIKSEPQFDTEENRIVEKFKMKVVDGKLQKLKKNNENRYDNINLDLSQPIHKLNELDIKKYRTEENKEGFDIAYNLLKKYEPEVDNIANDILGVTEKQGGVMIGLDFRLKRVDSLTRKLYAEINEAKEKGENITLQDAANRMGDIARFTSVFDSKNFQRNADSVIRHLQSQGYELVKFKNYFKKGSSYKGLNCNFRDKNGNMFELQFHTPQTMKIKEGYIVETGNRKALVDKAAFQSHDVYEHTRVLEDKKRQGIASDDEIIELKALKDYNIKMWDSIDYNFDNWTIENYKKGTR